MDTRVKPAYDGCVCCSVLRKLHSIPPSFRGAPSSARARNPYTPIVVMDCGPAPKGASWNDESECVGWAKARLRAVPTILPCARDEWWARHRTHSRPLALPTLRETPLRRRGGFLHAVEAEHLLGGGAAQALVGFPAGFEIGAVLASEVVAHVDDRVHRRPRHSRHFGEDQDALGARFHHHGFGDRHRHI